MQKKVMKDKDFDKLISRNNSTKVIKLSTFNENDLQSSKDVSHKRRNSIDEILAVSHKRRNSIDEILADVGPQKSDTRALADFLRDTSPEDLLGKSAQKFQREVSYANQNEDGRTNYDRRDHDDHSIRREQELIQNTFSNSSFIPVGKMGNKPKNPERAVTFAESMHNVPDQQQLEHQKSYHPTYQKPTQPTQVPIDFKPVFASRGSSLKNLKHVSGSSAFESDQDRSSYQEGAHQEQFPPPRTNSSAQDPRKPVPQYSDDDSSVISGSVSNSVMSMNIVSPLEGVLEKKVPLENLQVENGSDASMSSVTPPIKRKESSTARKAAIIPPRNKSEDKSGTNNQDKGGTNSHDNNDDMDFTDSIYDDYESHEQAEQHYSDIFDLLPENVSSKPTKNLDDPRLKEAHQEIQRLQNSLENSRTENESLKKQMSDQKQGFDKLSGQAYKKIKELLTDRSIMTIEIKSLKAQVLGIN
jgi:hypothetical protein